jgi:hypothetical protein
MVVIHGRSTEKTVGRLHGMGHVVWGQQRVGQRVSRTPECGERPDDGQERCTKTGPTIAGARRADTIEEYS